MSATKITTYPAPAGIQAATDFKMEVNGQPLFLYEAKVNFSRIPDKDLFPELTPFAYFDMQGEVEVTITAPHKLDCVDIRPKSYGITPP